MEDFQSVRYMPRLLVKVLASLLFFIMIVGIVDQMIKNPYPPGEFWLGIFSIVLFSFIFLIYFVQLLPGASWLSLDQEGFTSCFMYKQRRYLWKEVKNFRAVTIAGTWNKMVYFDLLPTYQQRPGVIISKVAKLFGTGEAALSDTYGHSAGDLVEIMNRWCKKFGSTE